MESERIMTVCSRTFKTNQDWVASRASLFCAQFGIGRLLIINQPTCSLAVALAKWNCVSEFSSTFFFQSLQFLLQRSAPWIRGFKPSWVVNFLISRNEGDEFAVGKPISFLAIVVCVAVINFSSPHFFAIWKNQLSILQQCESEHLLSSKINRLVLVCVRLTRSSKNGPLNGTVTKKRDGNGTAVYGKNGNDNGKFGFKNGPSLVNMPEKRSSLESLIKSLWIFIGLCRHFSYAGKKTSTTIVCLLAM